MSNGLLKRERPDDAMIDVSNKRRDTGESKGSTPAPSTPQGTASPAQPNPHSMLPPATPPGSMPPPTLSGSSSGVSPSMPPPSMPLGVSQDPNIAQMNAARERARHMQMRQAMQQQQQQQQSMGDAMMSGGHGQQQAGMSMQNVAGSSSMAHNPQAQMAALTSMGPMAMQALQVLQNPNHQMVQYLTQSVPGFQTLPLQQQIQHLQKLQVCPITFRHRLGVFIFDSNCSSLCRHDSSSAPMHKHR